MQFNRNDILQMVQNNPQKALICAAGIGIFAGYILGHRTIGNAVKSTIIRLAMKRLIARVI